MEAPYDVNLPIESLFEKIKDVIKFVVQGRIPFSNKQVVSTVYMLVTNTGIFSDKYKAWRRMASNIKI